MFQILKQPKNRKLNRNNHIENKKTYTGLMKNYQFESVALS